MTVKVPAAADAWNQLSHLEKLAAGQLAQQARADNGAQVEEVRVNGKAVTSLDVAIDYFEADRRYAPTPTDYWLDKKILAYASHEAESMMHPYVGTEHLLIGILRVDPCVAGRILMNHGFNLYPFNVNFQVVPGYDYGLKVTPTEAGDFRIICNEFCGIGHHVMVGRVIVTPPEGGAP